MLTIGIWIALGTTNSCSTILKNLIKPIPLQYHFRPQKHVKSFDAITREFRQKLKQLNLAEKAFKVNKYFSEGLGEKSSLKLLFEDGLIDSPKDFKGIYIFIKNKTPIYTGISKGVIKRIIQHTKGHSHHTSSFAFSLARASYQKETGDYNRIPRKDFNYKEHVAPAKHYLLQQKIAFMKIEDDIELYLFEIYCAMELQTLMYNSFSTH